MPQTKATNSNVLPTARIREIERRLGLPDPPDAYYAQQRKDYEQWHSGVAISHEWFFDRANCSHCKRTNRVVLAARNRAICLPCLQTGIPWYPSGWVQPKVTELLSHLSNCTSRWSYPTSASTTPSDKARTSSRPHIGPALLPSMSSSRIPDADETTSSTGWPW